MSEFAGFNEETIKKHSSFSLSHTHFSLLSIINAKVPILRFRDLSNKIEIDLTYNNCIGVRNTHLLFSYTQRKLQLIISHQAQLFSLLFLLSWLASPTNGIGCETIGEFSQHKPKQHNFKLQSRFDGDSFHAKWRQTCNLSLPSSALPWKVSSTSRHHNHRHGGEMRCELEDWESSAVGWIVPAFLGLLITAPLSKIEHFKVNRVHELMHKISLSYANQAITIRTGGLLPVEECKNASRFEVFGE